jgi:hypothetical protein
VLHTEGNRKRAAKTLGRVHWAALLPLLQGSASAADTGPLLLRVSLYAESATALGRRGAPLLVLNKHKDASRAASPAWQGLAQRCCILTWLDAIACKLYYANAVS